MTDQSSLKGRVALITGAGVGIGRAIAESLAEAGAFVGLHCHRSMDGANEVFATIQQRGGNGMVLQADLGDADEATRMVDRFVEAAGRLDILVNNAGSPIERRKIEDCPLELWRRVLDINLTSAFVVTQRAIPHLKRSGHGAIVNNLSLSVQTGGANGAGAY
ncbi:MAG: SDR family NAD(P)-dependent oxidoreductase, partial [Planctomycetaceae bacterium]|nr:SDR family NAD(P)-dependent oxidoreductase [Planctomycetaceae bacterium]